MNGNNVIVWDAWNQDLYLRYFFFIRRMFISFRKRRLAILAVKLILAHWQETCLHLQHSKFALFSPGILRICHFSLLYLDDNVKKTKKKST